MMTFEELEQIPKNPKFLYTDQDGQRQITTKTRIINSVNNMLFLFQSKDEALEDMFSDLEKIKVERIYRDDKIHNLECEFAIGNSCICWCGEKYHGWRGRKE